MGGWIITGIMIWKSKGGWRRWYYDVQIKRRMNNGGHYKVEMKGWMEKEALSCAN